MADEPENLTLAILREIRANMATKTDVADLRSDLNSLARATAADLHDLDAKLSNQLTSLREAVMHYHSSVLGHGVIIGELEARIRRVERHLNIDSDS